MDREQRIKRIVKRYQLISLWIVCGMSLIGFLLVHLGDLTDHIYSVGFCSVYQLVVNRFSIMAWRAIALHSPNIMGRYYMACGAFRMLLDLNVVIDDYDKDNFVPQRKGHLCVLDVPLNDESVPGVLNVKNASYVLKTLDIASDKSQSGEFSGIITGPISKAVIADTGLEFTGHTEYFQERTGTNKVVMMLGCDELNVALATTHLPLNKVSEAITEELLTEIVTILNHDLKTKFGIDNPCIISAGLNPHAGEDGHLGMEEIETIIPTFEKLRKEGINIIGPLPADTMFQKKYIEKADAFLTMYHDH